MSTELLLLGFIRATASELVKQVDVPVLFAIVCGSSAGVAVPAEAWPEGLAGLQLQNRVLLGLNESDGVLPVRTGTVFGSAGEIQELIARYDSEIRRRLDLIAGKVELGLDLWTTDSQATCGPADGPGRQYLRRLCGAVADPGPVGAFCVALHQRLTEISAESERLACLRPSTVFRASYLLPKEKVEEFKSLVTGEVGGMNELGFLITGPWPPYSFSCLELEKGEGSGR
ncbi:MAG: GvpL/GvpF family gas vesicle protein [Bacillota bacterium]